jgi:putative PEP-CTERM system histidine kinase
MLANLFWLTNFSLLAASFLAMRLPEVNRKFSLAIIQSLLFLPLLVVEYLAVTLNFIPAPEGFTILFASHNLFLVIWGTAARRLRDTMFVRRPDPTIILGFLHAFVVVLILAVALLQVIKPSFVISRDSIRASQFGPVYLASLVTILVMLLMAWQLEAFWRQLPKTRHREYGLFVVSGTLICVVQGGVASYLVTYLELTNDILFLQATFLLISWVLLVIAVLRHRLLKRNFFVSRKIVYSIVAPSLFAVYFLSLGTISLVIKFYDYPFKLVLFWFLVGLGAVGLAVLAVYEPARQRLKFFISTHFYVDKYEYRDEWLAFSLLLQHANSEAKVLDTLHQVLVNTLYTKEIWIWTGSEADGFELVVPTTIIDKDACSLTGNDPVISYLRQQPYLDLTSPIEVESDTFNGCLASLPPPRPILFVPLIADGQLVGCIGLGPEYTGSRYGQDDYDLLTALGSQAASALIAVRLTEETARMRERRALHNISAFLLHDIKNAASILSLIYANAQEHMDNPEFRKDMLTAIGDALQRMEKAQTSLGMLRDRVESVWQDVMLCHFLDELLVRFGRRLPGLNISLDCPRGITLRTDPQLLETVLENLFLNAYEAGNGNCQVHIAVLSTQDGLTISIANNGPAISEHLLPDQLFQRFVSDKPDGSGIGLWQARLVLQRLGATITANNPSTGGACFIIYMPRAGSSSAPVGQSDSV